ncbi:MAG: ABC transporter substrate-binding protein, partial [Sulfolobales archaeon]
PYTLKITLRSGAYWWDGEPITADDVVFTFNLGRLCTTTGSYIWNYITDVKALDPLNVVFYINKSNVNYYRVVDILTWMILPKHRWENLYNQMGCKIATDFQDTDPSKIVGGGPYRLLYWSGDTWVYERVDNWWGAKYFGLPAPKYVMHIVPKSDEQVRLEWIQGNRDHMSHFVDRLWEIIQQNPKRGTFDNTNCPPCFFGGSVVFFALNLDRYPFNDTRVRHAIYYALLANNMEAIKKASSTAYSGYLLPPQLYPVPIIPGIPRTEKYLARDLVEAFMREATLENAKRLLDEAGIVVKGGMRVLPDGRPFKFSILVVTGWVPVIGSALQFAEYLKENLGIDVSVEQKDFTVVYSSVQKGDFDAVWWMHSTRIGPSSPWINFDVAMDSRLSRNPWSGPISGYSNPEVNQILDELGRTWDDAKRMELYRKLQEIWLRDLPMLILGQDPHWYEYSEDYWVGWPNKERIERYGSFYATNWDPGFLFVLFEIKPASQVPPGQVPPVPDFLKPENRIPAATFFNKIQQVAMAPTATQPQQVTQTATQVQTVAVTSIVTITEAKTITQQNWATVTAGVTITTTTSYQTVDWNTTIGVSLALLVVGLSIGYLLRARRK